MRLASSLMAALLLTPTALGGDPRAQQLDLDIGPLIGGEDFVAGIRSTETNAPGLLLVSLDGLPTVIGPPSGPWPAFSLNLAGAQVLQITTGPTGHVHSATPTVLGQFGPSATGLVLFSQAVVLSQTGQRLASDREAVEIEPLAPFPGFLTDVAATNLPVGSDQVVGVSVETGDINRDGVPDALLTGIDQTTGDVFLAVWRNNGAGKFIDETTARLPGFAQDETIGSVTMADFDGDGVVDFVLSGVDSDVIDVADRLFLNDGTGVFTEAAGFDGGTLDTLGFTTGDFDNDGRIDVVRVRGAATHTPGAPATDQLVLNTAGGWVNQVAFEDAAWNNPLQPVTFYEPGDIDNDGDLDLLRAQLDAPNQLLENDGAGTFVDATSVRMPGALLLADATLDAAFVDLDMDGWLDLVTASAFFNSAPGDSGDLYWNDGTGVLVEDDTSDLETFLPTDGFRVYVSAADLDSDGDVDLHFAAHDLFAGANSQVYLNQGGAQGGTMGHMLREFWFDPGDYIAGDIEVLDMDFDGDMDILELANGVVSGDPADGTVVRLFENTNL